MDEHRWDAMNYSRMNEIMAAWKKRQAARDMKEMRTVFEGIRPVASTKRPPDEPLITREQAADLAAWCAR